MLTLGDDVEKGLLNPVVIRAKQEKPKQIFFGREQVVVVVVVVAPKKSFTRSCKKKGNWKWIEVKSVQK